MSRHFAIFSKMVAHMSGLHAYELPFLIFSLNGCSHVGLARLCDAILVFFGEMAAHISCHTFM
jgi:hypothetical protein